MKKYFITSILSIALFACNSEAELKQIQKVNSLEQRLDSNFAEIQTIDSSKIFNLTSHFFENKEYLETKYNDTIDNDLARFVDKYLNMKKACALINKSYSRTKTELKSTNERLDNLKHDLKEGIIEENQFQQYYQLESNNVVVIEESVNDILYAIEAIQPLYDSMNPKIDSLISESKRKAAVEAE